MRVSVIGRNSEQACRIIKGTNVRHLPRAGVTFADLTPAQIEALQRNGYSIQQVRQVSVQQVTTPPPPPAEVTPEITVAGMFEVARYAELVEALNPPAFGLGEGITIALLDTGIRETHVGLEGKVVHRADFSGTGHCNDIFDHGTGTAWLAVGGRPDPTGFRGIEEPQGFAPKASLMNIKVLDDQGEGTTETVTAGLDEVIRLWDEHPPAFPRDGSPEPLRPDIVNLSLGAPDAGDPMEPTRVAIRQCLERNIAVQVAAGNEGEITSPATEEGAHAVGAIDLDLQVRPWSGRGPTIEGLIKPDFVFFGSNLVMASAASDTAMRNASGTSFAVACASGGHAVQMEALIAAGGGLRPLEPELRANLPRICKKPAGVPPEKDCVYGWGIPFGDLILDRVQEVGLMRAAGETLQGTMGMMVPVLGIAMVAKIMRGLTLGKVAQ